MTVRAGRESRVTEMDVDEFVRRLIRRVEGQANAAFFLGAGTSRSSGIPTAGPLTLRWLQQLHEEGGGPKVYEDWLHDEWPEFDPDDVGALYSPVMKRLFISVGERQEEVERLVAGKDPGFGYATFAQLLTHATLGPSLNVVLTTNFDDLVADALRFFTPVRPLVVTHPNIAQYATHRRERPTIVKLHGDAMIQPLNDEQELLTLDLRYVDLLSRLLENRMLIFIGYGGHDEGVTTALKSLPSSLLSRGIYWVSDRVPDTQLGQWLESRDDAVWVRHLDFDALMAVVKAELNIPAPDSERFDRLLDNYQRTFAELGTQVGNDSGSPSLVRESVDTVGRGAATWVSDLLAAQRAERDGDFKRATSRYMAALGAAPENPLLLGAYASFLHTRRHDNDQAEHYYREALQADPNDATNLVNYANFLANVRHDNDQAEHCYQRALQADPDDADTLGNYAVFLTKARHDNERAQLYFVQALLAADFNNAGILGNYAIFVQSVHHDNDQAEHYYQRALQADRNNVNNLNNYALFLTQVRQDYDQAEHYYQQALLADPNNANTLSNYADFLTNVRHDNDQAEHYYRQALLADPHNANTLGNYAQYLLSNDLPTGPETLTSAVELVGDDEALQLELALYQSVYIPSERSTARKRFAELLESGARSPGFDLSSTALWARTNLDPVDADLISRLVDVIGEVRELDPEDLERLRDAD